MKTKLNMKISLAAIALSVSHSSGKSAVMDYIEGLGVNVIKSDDLIKRGTQATKVWIDEAGEITQEHIDYMNMLKDED